MTFKNETADTMEISVPITVQASIRFYIEPGEELTAEKVNAAVDQLAWAASDDVFRHPRVDGDWTMSVLGVEPGGVAYFYNHEKEGDVPLPDGVEYATQEPAFAYVLTIDHRHGTNTTVHRTEQGARADLATFCRQYAADDAFIINTDKMTDDEIIEAYFAVMNEQDEFYSIERAELLA